MSRKMTARVSGGVAGIVVMLVILIALNIIVDHVHLGRLDLTEGNLYTLSDGSREILGNLQKDVAIKFFFSRSSRQLNSQVKTYASRVEDLMRELKIAAKGRLSVDILDPKPDTDQEDWAIKFGMSRIPDPYTGAVYFMGVVAESGKQTKLIKALDAGAEHRLEYDLMRLIHHVANPKRPVLGVLSSLPVMGVQAPPFAMPGQPLPQSSPAWYLFEGLDEDYDVRRLDPGVETISPEIDELLVVHPKNFSPRTVFAIDQFLLQGGNLLVFVDPLAFADPAIRSGGYGGGQPNSDLPRLFAAWGINYNANEVTADLNAATRMTQRGRNPTYLSLQAGQDSEYSQINSNDMVTADLEYIQLPYAGAFSGDGVDGLTVTPLLTSSPDSDGINAVTMRMNPEAVDRQFKNSHQSRRIAVRLHGRFPTAFPDGPPEDPAADDPAADRVDPAHLTESSEESAVILVADVDMLLDDVCVRRPAGLPFIQILNDNMHFFANAVEQLCGATELISLRARGRSVRPFDRVEKIAARAQAEWMDEYESLQAKQAETRQQLSLLQTQKDPNQRDILSPGQKQALERYEREDRETSLRLREVQKALRRDIDRLGAWLKVINIVGMPLLVGIAGISFGVYRKRRMRAAR